MSFYLYLPSNVSPQYYPCNRVSCYKTKLPKRFKFNSKEYEVALTEFLYVNSIKTFQRGEAREIKLAIDVVENEKISYVVIPDKTYVDIEMLICELNDNLKFSSGPYAEFKYLNNRVHCTLITGALIVHERLCTVLGLKVPSFDGLCVINNNMTGMYPPNLAPEMFNIFIYCDIITPQIVGDSMCPLLRTVNLSPRSGEVVSETFRPYYVQLSQLEFDTIEILICNEFGEEIYFDKAQCIVTLHFRRTKNGN